MIILGYIGNHDKDTLPVRLGWALTRAGQRGAYKRVTHTESVLAGNNYKSCTIASSSARDKGVRIKENIALTKGNWIAADVPLWDVAIACAWFLARLGCQYDWLGAVGSIIFFVTGQTGKYFCNNATGEPFIQESKQYPPAKFWAIAMSMPGARDVTDEFFKD
jgi:hypothetical protein